MVLGSPHKKTGIRVGVEGLVWTRSGFGDVQRSCPKRGLSGTAIGLPITCGGARGVCLGRHIFQSHGEYGCGWPSGNDEPTQQYSTSMTPMKKNTQKLIITHEPTQLQTRNPNLPAHLHHPSLPRHSFKCLMKRMAFDVLRDASNVSCNACCSSTGLVSRGCAEDAAFRRRSVR